MKIGHVLIAVLALGFLSACNQQKQKQPGRDTAGADTATAAIELENFGISTSEFTEIDSSGLLIFPLSVEVNTSRDGSYSLKKLPSHHYWNLLFYDSRSGKHHLLDERKMLISNFHLKYSSEYDESIRLSDSTIFYEVRVDDFNRDRKLTIADPEYLFASDKTGKNFRQLSPAGFELLSWKYIKRSNKVVMIMLRDSNRNRKFGDEDEMQVFETDVATGQQKPVFTDSLNLRLKQLYARDWRRIED